MELGRLNEEIEKIDMVKYHRVFVPTRENMDDVADDIWVETADIYIKDEIPLEQAIDELEKTCILDHCYATITTQEEQQIYITKKPGCKAVIYLGELYKSLSDLVTKTDAPLQWQAVNEINLSFNTGSFQLLFGSI